jgi:hypothetical protein
MNLLESNCKIAHSDALPRARGIELILLGGIKPTSVTTAVIYVGGVRSYRGFRLSKSCEGDIFSKFVFSTIDKGTKT